MEDSGSEQRVWHSKGDDRSDEEEHGMLGFFVRTAGIMSKHNNKWEQVPKEQ